MNINEREGLIARIRARSGPLAKEQPPPEAGQGASRVQLLENRIAHLEELVQGLQDSIYREAQRDSRRLAELEAKLDPAALAAALSKHAREHGL